MAKQNNFDYNSNKQKTIEEDIEKLDETEKIKSNNPINVPKILKNFDSNQNQSSNEEMKNQLIADINKTMKLLDIDSNDVKSIENLDENEFYFRNDPIYREINGYIVGEVLGEGTFGTVKEFVNKFSLKRYAAKIMNSQWIAKKGQHYLDNINLEINLVRKLNHKNIIKIYEFFTIETKYYLITEYCYASLDDYLKEKPLKGLPISQANL